MDRFDDVHLPTDFNLEKELVGYGVADKINDIRQILLKWNVEKDVSMRDSIRMKQREELKLMHGFVEKLLDNQEDLYKDYKEIREKKEFLDQSECNTVAALFKNIKKSQGIFDEETT